MPVTQPAFSFSNLNKIGLPLAATHYVFSLFFFYTSIRLAKGHTFRVRPVKREITNRTKKTKNRIFAIPAAPAAIPPNPNTAATIATIRKITDQRNIVLRFKFKNWFNQVLK